MQWLELVLGQACWRDRADERRLLAGREADLDRLAAIGVGERRAGPRLPLDSIERSQARCSSPQRRSSSIVPVLATVARGSVEVDSRRSTTSVSIPYEPRVIAVARPAGPLPTTTTSTRSSTIIVRGRAGARAASSRSGSSRVPG